MRAGFALAGSADQPVTLDTWRRALRLAKADFDSVIERKFPDIPFITLSELLPPKVD